MFTSHTQNSSFFLYKMTCFMYNIVNIMYKFHIYKHATERFVECLLTLVYTYLYIQIIYFVENNSDHYFPPFLPEYTSSWE